MKHITLLLLLIGFNALAAPVQLDWVAPTERQDNTALPVEEIAGFKAYYGLESGVYTDSITIPDNTATSTVIDLPTGFIYDIVMTTYDTEGRESIYSEAVNVALDHFPPKQMAKPTATVLPLQ